MRKLLAILIIPHLACAEDFEQQRIQEQIDDHRVLHLINRGMIPDALKLEELPRDLKYPKGVVSVIPDPKDQEDGRIIVYLINDTDEPLKEGLSTVRNCFQEVSMDSIWTLSSSPRWQDCGTGLVFESKDLPQYHAAIFFENDPAIGDLTGSLRYCVNIQGSKAIASAPFEGRFRSKEFDRAGDGVTSPAGRFLHDIPLAAKAPAWKEIEAAKKREEIVASLELQRHYHADWAIRQRASQWAEILAKENADEPCRNAIREILSKPWKKDRDEAALFQRCRETLLADEKDDWPYGSPERRKEAAWKQLADLSPSEMRNLCNPERLAKLDAINASGNPWGAAREEAVGLAALAVQRIKSAPADEGNAASYFLQRTYIRDLPPLEDWGRELLKSDSPVARETGLSLLLRANKKKEALAWLEMHAERFRSETGTLLPLLVREPSDLKGWQVQMILHWLEDDYAHAVSYLSENSYAPEERSNSLAPALQASITRYLENEAMNPKVIEEAPLQRDEEGKIQIIDRGFHPRLHVLRMSITLVAAWRDPAHTPLLEKFLRHPACQYSISQDRDGREKINRLYSIREQVKEVLRDREVVVGKDVVTFEEVPLKDLPPKNPER